LTAGRVAFAAVAVAVFVIDRVTKSLVSAHIALDTEVSVISGVVGLTNIHNSGAAFGLAPAGAPLFLIAEVAVSIALIWYVASHRSGAWTDGVFGLIVGGALGNAYDRIAFGTVTDFVHFQYWPVFNAADSAVSIGVVALAASQLLRKSPPQA
jgi:signal peptidase II